MATEWAIAGARRTVPLGEAKDKLSALVREQSVSTGSSGPLALDAVPRS